MNRLLHDLHTVPSRSLDAVLGEARHSNNLIGLTGYPAVEDYPPWLAEAAANAVARSRIAPPAGMTSLREAVAKHVANQTGQDLTWRNVLITAGAMNAISIAWLVLADQGDCVIVPAPNYFVDGSLSLLGRSLCVVRNPPEGVFGASALVDHLVQHRGASHPALYISNPNNPTGRLMLPGEWRMLLELAEQHSIRYLVLDESYSSMVWDTSFEFWTASSNCPVAVVRIGSFSKAYSMPWLRCGWLVADEALVNAAEKVVGWLNLFGATVVQAVALAAVEGDQAWLTNSRVTMDRNRRRMVDELGLIRNLSISLPQAGPFVYPRFNGVSATHMAQKAIKFGLPLVPGPAFGDDDSSARVPFIGEPEEVTSAINAMKEMLND